MALQNPEKKTRDNIPKRGKPVWLYRWLYHSVFLRQHPRILCNSFQKSGTHLLLGVVSSLDPFHSYGRKAYWHYVNRARAEPTKVPTISQVMNKLSRCLPGEIYRGHIAAHAELIPFLTKHHFKHLFIYRDLRDVVISYFFGVKRGPVTDTWVSRYFYSLKSDQEVIEFLIKGWPSDLQLDGFPQAVDYPNIGERFRENLPWLSAPNCLAVRFEDLVRPETRGETHAEIARYLLPDADQREIRAAVSKMDRGHNPKDSHTFRRGIPGDWRTHFSKKHVMLFKELAGQMLIDLGYEKNLDW